MTTNVFSSFIGSLTKGCTCSTQQTKPNVPANQKPTAKIVKKAIADASSSASSSSSSLKGKVSTKVSFHVCAEDYLPISETLTTSQKQKIMEALFPETNSHLKDQVPNLRIGIERSGTGDAKMYTVVVEGLYTDKPCVQYLTPVDGFGLAYNRVDAVVEDALHQQAYLKTTSEVEYKTNKK